MIRPAPALAAPGGPREPVRAKESAKAGEPNGDRAVARRAELERLWEGYWSDSSEANRNSLVEAYQDFARQVTRRFAARLPRSVDRGDLETAAGVGVMGAVSGFDPGRGVPFESYCELRIKGALLDELRSQDWLPRHWRHRFGLQKRALERLRSEFEREPHDHEVALEMGVSLDDYLQTFCVALPGGPPGSMPADEGPYDLPSSLEVVPDTHTEAPGEEISRNELLILVSQQLTDQEYRILYLRYWEGLAMREIGELLDISESRVCKLHARLLARLKEPLASFL